MKSLGALALLCLAAACGDNSKQCGPGTVENQGVCEPDDGSGGLICGDGTVRDELTNECVPDPSVCGGGTVLINGQCKDPSDNLPIDAEEAAEPNGFESDATPAGIITLKPVGQAFVIKGCIAPIDNNTPDFDIYELDVDAPTLLHITADGVQGLAAGFLMNGDAAPLAGWVRLGINISTDTSKREVYLPAAGHYRLIMSDTRTLLPLTNNGEGLPAAGNPDGTSCYFVTINQRAIPTAQPLDLTAVNVGTIGEELKFFTANFQTGLNTMAAVIDPEGGVDQFGNPLDSHAASSLVLLGSNQQVRQINDADADSPVSSAVFGGLGSSSVVILDYVWNYAIGPAAYEVEMIDQTSSLPLVNGTPVNDTSNGQVFSVDGEPIFDNVNLFHFDVAADGTIMTMDFTSSIPLQGSIVDQDGFIASPLTSLVLAGGSIETFTQYKGLFRAFAPGRYYFFVFAPRDPVGTPFTITSTITPVTPPEVGNFESDPFTFNAVRSNIFSHEVTGVPWRTFDALAEAGVGKLDIALFDPAVTLPGSPGFAFGRLDAMTVTRDANPPSTKVGDAVPLFSSTLEPDGTTPLNVITKDPFAVFPPSPTDLLVKLNATVPNPAGTFILDFGQRQLRNLGTIAAGNGSSTGTLTMTAGSDERFFFQTAPGNQVTITATPEDNQPNLDLVIELLRDDEVAYETIDNVPGSVEETRTGIQTVGGFTAFRVRGASGANAGTYIVSVNVEASDYAMAQTPGGFIDACTAGQVLPTTEDSVNPGIPDDEGLTASIALPTGFTLFGTAATTVKASTNGFLSLDLALNDATFANTPLAATPTVAIAPHWEDMFGVEICKLALPNNRLVIQWNGFSVTTSAPVQTEAILDANGTITFAYGPFHFADGSTATIGVQAGGKVFEVGFLSPVEVTDSSITLSPN